jgi:predicted ATPase
VCALTAALSERQLLLVLDNFEHLLGAAPLVADLLAAAPSVDILCTSREPLRIRGEHRMDVPPLAAGDARELFRQRALAVRSDLTFDNDDDAAIERICARLDGLPLAIELAAPRVAVFAPAVLEKRLAAHLALPEGPRDLPERQRTLAATIDWSYQLLELEERALMQSLSPFIGGVRFDSAESIWGVAASDALLSLSDKSLVRRREDPDGEPRFWMLETVREFATERAAAEGTAAEGADVHASHLLSLLEEAEPRLLGPDQKRWLDRIEAEYPNLRTALDHLTVSAPEQALRMAGILTWFWDVRGYLPEGRQRLLDVLARSPDEGPDRPRALWGAGRIQLLLGDAAAAGPLLREAATSAMAAGDARMAINALSNLGWALQALGDRAQSLAVSEQAIALARVTEDDWALAVALNNHGDQFLSDGEFGRARPLFEEALAVRRRGGEPRGIALTACNLAQAALAEGDFEAAEALIEEALAHGAEIDYATIIGELLVLRAILALAQEDLQGAQHALAQAGKRLDDTHEAEAVAMLLSAAGLLAAACGESLRAATLWAAADQARVRINRAETPAAAALRQRWLPKAQAATSVQGWDAAWAAGAKMPLDEALSLAQG